MKKMVAAMMLFLLISTQMKSVEPDAADCSDGCSTACVQSDSRLQARCERKCSIRCGPDSTIKEDMS
uniref:Thionin-like protein n=1 Tax=Glycine max TaxID=3847 RepID=C6SY67_SOYBN|nr:unknown [Glycine max]